MQNAEKKINSLLFDEGTTYRTDYQSIPLKEYPKTDYKPKINHYVRDQPAYRNVHTLTEWKGTMPTFHALHKSKEVVKTNPWIVQKAYVSKPWLRLEVEVWKGALVRVGKNTSKYKILAYEMNRMCDDKKHNSMQEKPIDIDREKAQKSRPRLVMTPAVSMDDIEDPRARDILCTDMYTSDMTRGMREAVAPYNNVRASFTGLPAPANPIVLQKLQPPAVPPEWRMESAAWDGRQLRSYCDVTRDFWLSHKLSKCRACEETAIARENVRKVKQGK